MKALRTIAVTFSLYSRIPMPKFDWEDRDMRHTISVFPWVGLVIGMIYYAVLCLGKLLSVPDIVLGLLMAAVPVIVTGGFHVDGYMDTKDALNSYKPREEKLKILKDPHTGAFAVIWLAVCGLVFAAMQIMVVSSSDVFATAGVLALSFFLARCQSAFDVIMLPPARRDGMLRHESTEALKAKKINLTILTAETLAVIIGMLFINVRTAVIAVAVTVLWNLIYANRCKRIFGGTTGDTAGYFLVKCELYIAAASAVVLYLAIPQ